MKISFPPKEVGRYIQSLHPSFCMGQRSAGVQGVRGGWSGATPREPPHPRAGGPPPRDRYVIWAGRHGDRGWSGAAPRAGCTPLRGPEPNEKIDTTLFGTNPSIKIFPFYMLLFISQLRWRYFSLGISSGTSFVEFYASVGILDWLNELWWISV